MTRPAAPEAHYSVIPDHEIPQEVIDFTNQALHDDTEALRITQPVWERLGKSPNLRRYINQSAVEIEPDNPHAQQDITRRMLGLLAILEEGGTTDTLEALLSSPAYGEAEASDAFGVVNQPPAA